MAHIKSTKAQRKPYDVGYGRPPKKSQFKRGESGNPTGAKRKVASVAADLRTSLEQALNQPAKFRIGERELSMTKAAAGITQLVTQFSEGDRHARRDLIALADKLGVDLTAGQQGNIGEAVATVMSANDEAIIADFLRRHGVEPELVEAKSHSISDQELDGMTASPAKEK